MVVVSIIGILAAIAIPKFAEMVRKAKEGQTKGNLGGIRSALSIYYADMEGHFPQNANGGALYTGGLLPLTINGKYLSTIPQVQAPNYHPATSVDDGFTFNSIPICGSNPYALLTRDMGEWAYDGCESDSLFGTVLVNCTHTDTKGIVWTTY